MLIGAMSVDLFIGEAASLKDKRRYLKSIIERIKSRFNVSIAEVDQQELWQRSTLGVSCVSNERVHVDKMLSSVINFIEAQDSVEIINYNYEIL
ncbi:DUF503 domain-containing protein [Desulfolucanica intricata]|uniref:DUF503 domain-containing protein n=1 Tax=Desulfolucanica intricata TaxID=1285191 RepID=UPI00083251DE|nr:DUF503 domain-containing protein [Desulfolucanica intricata]